MSESKAQAVSHLSLKVATDLEQDKGYFPIKSGVECLAERIGSHWSKVPADARRRLESTTVVSSDSVRRDTIGAANPFAYVAAESEVGHRTSRSISASMVEKVFGADLATLTDPSKSDLMYPGIHLENGVVKICHLRPDSPDTTQWVDDGAFFTDAVQFTDPVQGTLADCYFIAALASTAWACPLLVSQRPAPTGQQGEFANSSAADAISFFDSGGRHDVPTTELLPQLNGNWIYARADDAKELWPGVYEKAFAMWKIGTTS
jgi:hypothetical protein